MEEDLADCWSVRVSRKWPGPLELASPTLNITEVVLNNPHVERSNPAGPKTTSRRLSTRRRPLARNGVVYPPDAKVCQSASQEPLRAMRPCNGGI
eukprot:10823227-Prorocentrum_lima.AAC.1